MRTSKEAKKTNTKTKDKYMATYYTIQTIIL
jgi:hypothetical protein